MATEYITTEGPIIWAKVFEQNRDFPPFDDNKDGFYTLTQIIDDAEKAKLEAAGCRKKLETNPDGPGWLYKPRRAHTVPGKDWAGGPPKIAKPDATPWSLEDDGLIGNGSVCLLVCQVYDSRNGKGTRLEAIQVLEHVPYASEGGAGPTSFFKDRTGGEAARDKAVVDFIKPREPKPEAQKREVLDDEIPF